MVITGGSEEMINLFQDQELFVGDLRAKMRESKAIVAVAQTGFGKTICGAYIMQKAAEKGSRCFFMPPRRELIKQTAKTLDKFGIDFGIVCAGFPFQPMKNIQICSPGTLVNRLDRIAPPHMIFHDEGHMFGAQTDKILDWAALNGAWRIALTATPQRLDGKGLDRHYDSMIFGPSLSDLIKMGRLADYRYFEPYTPDLSGIRRNSGDYSQTALDDAFSADNVRIGSAVEHFKKHAPGNRHVCFNVSVKDAEKTAEAFRNGGVSCAAVYGELGEEEITRRTRALARGELKAITSVNLLGVGWDISSASGMDCTIESVSLMRPTQSVSLYLQQVGRALRAKPEKAIIFDHSGLSKAHGYPDDERSWDLAGRVSNKRQGEASIPVRICPTCFMAHRPAPYCPYCGHKFETEGRTVEEVEGELVEVTREQAQQVAKQERRNQGQADTFEALLELERRKGNKRGWAESVWILRQAKKGVTVTRQELARARSQWRG